jgi:hypothetical protein
MEVIPLWKKVKGSPCELGIIAIDALYKGETKAVRIAQGRKKWL